VVPNGKAGKAGTGTVEYVPVRCGRYREARLRKVRWGEAGKAGVGVVEYVPVRCGKAGGVR